jgi:hypothetical protein
LQLQLKSVQVGGDWLIDCWGLVEIFLIFVVLFVFE